MISNRWASENLAWLAGILEGEAWFGIVCGRPQVQLEMTDEDIVLRVQSITGVGTICTRESKPTKNGGKTKPTWRWKVARQHEAAELMHAVYPWMGSRRRERIDEVLSAWKMTGRMN